MPVSHLTLGPFVFQRFEIPSGITWGGAHSLAIHRLPGGTRIIDAMGRDDADIVWSGIFSGPDAIQRAQSVDQLRSGGGIWPLVWDSFFFSVAIARFDVDQRRPNWIPYRIACTVLRDEASGLLQIPLSPAQTAAQDLATAVVIAPDPPASGLDAQLAVPIDLLIAPAVSEQAARQATARGYRERATKNQRVK